MINTPRFGVVSAVLFDLDGTLVDTAEDFVLVLNTQRERHQLSPLPHNDIRNTVSDGARALTKLAFGGDEGESQFEARRQELLELYEKHVGDQSALFPGMNKLLKHLEDHNIPWGIVTNKPRQYATPLLQKLSLSERCSILICPDDVTRAKPDPEALLLASNRLNTSPSSCLYVGDHERDIIAGRAANMATVAARYGYLKNKALCSDWQADFIIDHADDLRDELSLS